MDIRNSPITLFTGFSDLLFDLIGNVNHLSDLYSPRGESLMSKSHCRNGLLWHKDRFIFEEGCELSGQKKVACANVAVRVCLVKPESKQNSLSPRTSSLLHAPEHGG